MQHLLMQKKNSHYKTNWFCLGALLWVLLFWNKRALGVSPEDLKGLEGVLKTKNCNDSWNKVNYYINDVLCISEYI